MCLAMKTVLLTLLTASTFAQNTNVPDTKPQEDDACLTCLCRVIGRVVGECLTGQPCVHINSYGPLCITEPYWIDAGRPVMPGDQDNFPGAFRRCVEEPFCAEKTVVGYMTTGPGLKDCDKNGVIDCRDLVLTHLHGRYSCKDEPDRRVDQLEICYNASRPTGPSSPPGRGEFDRDGPRPTDWDRDRDRPRAPMTEWMSPQPGDMTPSASRNYFNSLNGGLGTPGYGYGSSNSRDFDPHAMFGTGFSNVDTAMTEMMNKMRTFADKLPPPYNNHFDGYNPYNRHK